jgi:hypothetical protein
LIVSTRRANVPRAMAVRAPLNVPVELRRNDERWFMLARAISVEGLGLVRAAPDELEGPLAVAFHLPGGGAEIRLQAAVDEEIVGEGEDSHAERRALRFLDIDEATRVRIDDYVRDRLGIHAWIR